MTAILNALVWLRELIEWIADGLTGDDTHLPQQDQWGRDILHATSCALVTLALGLWPGLILLVLVGLTQSGGGPRLDRWLDFGTSVGGHIAALGIVMGWWSAWPAAAGMVAMLIVTAAIRKAQELDE